MTFPYSCGYIMSKAHFSYPKDDSEEFVLSFLDICQINKKEKTISYLHFMQPLNEDERRHLNACPDEIFAGFGTRDPVGKLSFAYSSEITKDHEAVYKAIESRHKENREIILFVFDKEQVEALRSIAIDSYRRDRKVTFGTLPHITQDSSPT